jgi:hypothetical protein
VLGQQSGAAPKTPPAALSLSAPVLWVSAACDDTSNDDDGMLVPKMPPAANKTAAVVDVPVMLVTASSVLGSGGLVPPMAASQLPHRRLPEGHGVQCEAGACGDWQEVLPRHGPRLRALLVSSVAPRPIPVWLAGRCCRCLAIGHRAALCGDPFRCSRCLENGHRARKCRNAWRPLSSLGSPAMSSSPHLAAKVCRAPTPRRASNVSPISCASVVSSHARSLASAGMSLRSALEGKKTEEL